MIAVTVPSRHHASFALQARAGTWPAKRALKASGVAAPAGKCAAAAGTHFPS
jgi:hypothetical protein